MSFSIAPPSPVSPTFREQLRKEIAVGIAEADRGELFNAETVFDEVEQPGSSG